MVELRQVNAEFTQFNQLYVEGKQAVWLEWKEGEPTKKKFQQERV